jgi:hypothetical protein
MRNQLQLKLVILYLKKRMLQQNYIKVLLFELNVAACMKGSAKLLIKKCESAFYPHTIQTSG